jgi:hypothetical protein
MKKFFCFAAALFICLCANAEKFDTDSLTSGQLFQLWRNSKLLKNADTTYIGLPKKPWLVTVGNEGTITEIGVVLPGNHERFKTSSGLSDEMKIGLYYRGIGLSYGFNLRKAVATDLNLGTSGNVFNINFNYQRNKHQTENFGRLKLSTLDISGLYMLNNKKFSMNAATRQTYIQKKSAGSMLVAAQFRTEMLGADEYEKIGLDFLQNYLQMQANVGVGYGYNLVFGQRKFLLHASLVPQLIFLNKQWVFDWISFKGTPTKDIYTVSYGHMARLIGYYNLNDRLFLGFSGYDNLNLSSRLNTNTFSFNYWSFEVFAKFTF